MTTPAPEPTAAQLGLLDLAIDLSVPQVYSGTDFTVYLHVKNPFAVPVWIDSVELSLPTQLSWREPERTPLESSAIDAETLRDAIRRREARMTELRQELADLETEDGKGAGPAGRAAARVRIDDELTWLVEQIDREQARLDGTTHQLRLTSNDSSVVNLHGNAQQMRITANDASVVNLYDPLVSERERVPLVGSLPPGTALEPGSTDVRTIRLGTGRSPFFVPASYRLQVTVVYGLTPRPDPRSGDAPQPAGAARRRVFSNTTALTVPVKSALWNVMTGGALGGAVGSAGRSLQDTQSLSALFSQHLGTALGSLVLAVILSSAAIVFAARKSEAQSFVTVEDFWGGVLVGFLIGYSGTAAFSRLTGTST